jgi:hypothetical protein
MKTMAQYAYKLGYIITRQRGAVNFGSKIIYMDFNEYDLNKQEYLLSHELGHIQMFRTLMYFKVSDYYYNARKNILLLRLLDEALAWMIGFCLCVRFKVSVKGFFQYAFERWKTYWIYR